MKNYVFYHLYYINDAVDRFARTLRKIKNSGLYENVETIFLNVVGKNLSTDVSGCDQLFSLLSNSPNKIELFNTGQVEENFSESETLKLLWDKCQLISPESNVLYLHSKGVTRTSKKMQKPIQGWIDAMEYFLIERWNNSISVLDEHDACGCFLKTPTNVHKHPYPNFFGNFWWASASYIKKTKRWDMSYAPRGVKTPIVPERAFCEFWLLSPNNVQHNKPYCLFDVLEDKSFYNYYIEPSLYRKQQTI